MMPTTSTQAGAKASSKFISIDQVAARWGVHPRTVRRMIKSGRLAAVQVGRQYRISPDVLLHFEEKNNTSSIKVLLSTNVRM